MRASLFLLAASIGAAAAAGVCDINNPAHLCCKPDGTLYGKSRICRPACDVCDAVEYCDGVNPTCPPDIFAAKDVVCRPAVGVCDKPETCLGTGVKCPADGFYLPGDAQRCRSKRGTCDDDTGNFCNGGLLCPEPKYLPPTTVCNAASTDPRKAKCDPSEYCTGGSAFCPSDKKLSNCPCRPKDAAEFQSLFGTSAPADVLQFVRESKSVALPCGDYVCDSVNGCSIVPKSEGTPCAGENGCAAASFCDGTSFLCPVRVKPQGTVCRPSRGPCDTAETCDGTSAACPAETWPLQNTVCRPAYGTCDQQDICQANEPSCPDRKLTGVCRPASGPCDKEEVCDGKINECPRDSFYGAETLCRAAAEKDGCDITDYCSGAGPICYDSRYSNCEASEGTAEYSNVPVLLVEAL